MLQLSVFLQDFGVCLWGIFAHSSRRAFVMSDTVVGGDDLAHCQFLFIPKVLCGVEVRALCRPYLYGPWSIPEQKRAFTKLCLQSCLKCLGMLKHYNFPSLELKGPTTIP